MREPSFLFGVSKAGPPISTKYRHPSTIRQSNLTFGMDFAREDLAVCIGTHTLVYCRSRRIQTPGPQYSPNIDTLQLFAPSI